MKMGNQQTINQKQKPNENVSSQDVNDIGGWNSKVIVDVFPQIEKHLACLEHDGEMVIPTDVYWGQKRYVSFSSVKYKTRDEIDKQEIVLWFRTKTHRLEVFSQNNFACFRIKPDEFCNHFVSIHDLTAIYLSIYNFRES
jgi:hypothetical protein